MLTFSDGRGEGTFCYGLVGSVKRLPLSNDIINRGKNVLRSMEMCRSDTKFYEVELVVIHVDVAIEAQLCCVHCCRSGHYLRFNRMYSLTSTSRAQSCVCDIILFCVDGRLTILANCFVNDSEINSNRYATRCYVVVC